MKLIHNTWVQISILTLITALVWLGVSVRSTLIKSTISPDIMKLIEPLDPTLDQGAIENLKNRLSN